MLFWYALHEVLVRSAKTRMLYPNAGTRDCFTFVDRGLCGPIDSSAYIVVFYCHPCHADRSIRPALPTYGQSPQVPSIPIQFWMIERTSKNLLSHHT